MVEKKYEGKIKEIKIIEKNTGDKESKEAQVTIITADEQEIIIKKLHWSEAKGFTPKDDVKVTIVTTQTKLTT